MIVKNEAQVIERCLNSVLPFISHWTIVDTGSSDGTQTTIRKLLAEVPGQLYERPWVNFAQNRSESLSLAAPHSDYLLVIDADDVLMADPDFVMPTLTHDAYSLVVSDRSDRYERMHLVRTVRNWRYEGVLHEYITCDGDYTMAKLPGLTYQRIGGGARSRNPNQFLSDAKLLHAALEDEPDNARYAFYLAQSWRDAGKPRAALKAYQQRIKMGGWAEEVWFSMYQVARLSETIPANEDEIVGAYLRAHAFRPTRAESLTKLAVYHRNKRQWPLAWLFASAAVNIKCPDDVLFVDQTVYAWQALDEYAVSASWVGRYTESATACRRLLADGNLPATESDRVQQNLALAERLGGQGGAAVVIQPP